jgi:cytochrome c553
MFAMLPVATLMLVVLPLSWACRDAGDPEAVAATASAGGGDAVAVPAGLPATTAGSGSGSTALAAATAASGPVERGRYLVRSIGCGDCHSPKLMTPQGPVEDEARLLSGHPAGEVLQAPPALNGSWIAAASPSFTAWSGPWGISYTANLTPDQNTGLGIWTEDMFVKAIRTGRHMGQSRPILPPMPWQQYSNLSDEDLAAIYAYLRTLPPVSNRVPEPVPPAGAPGAEAAAAGG